MSNFGWNVKSDGAERPIQPTAPPSLAPHQNIATNVNIHPSDLPPPTYNSIYPQVPSSNTIPPYVPPQNHVQIPGTSTTIHTNSHPASPLQQMQNMGAQIQPQMHAFISNPVANTLWLPASEGQVPPGAVIGGHEVGGEKLYVARARHGGALIPGKLVPSHRCCYVSWSGREHAVKHYEVLCNCTGKWIPASSGNYSPRALAGGNSEKGETLYIGRANHRGSQTIGKVHPSHKLCYIPYAGKEIGFKAYEVFVPDN